MQLHKSERMDDKDDITFKKKKKLLLLIAFNNPINLTHFFTKLTQSFYNSKYSTQT